VGVMPMITTVNRKGQVPIPESLRDRYGYPPGTKVVWLERDGDLIPKPLLSVEQLRGRFKGEDTLDQDELDKLIASRVSQNPAFPEMVNEALCARRSFER